MNVILSTMECPKWTHAHVKGLYPTAAVIGSTYGWFHHVPETNVVFMDYGWANLVKQVTAHMRGNGIAVPADLNVAMMQKYCEVTQSSVCGDSDDNAPERQRLMMQAARFLRTMNEFISGGAHFVSQEEAERRASLCAACPFNSVEVVGCTGCAAKTALAQLAKYVIGKSTSQDNRLQSCSVCGCRTALKVHIPIEAMNEADLKNRWHSTCWMRPENS